MGAPTQPRHSFSPEASDTAKSGAAAKKVTRTLLVAGGLFSALGAASCCVVPFALFVLGISGAWIGNLTALQPYQPLFVAIAAASIGCGLYLVYRRPTAACLNEPWCASSRSTRLTKAGLWVAAVLVVIAVGFPKLVPLFL
jgi:mercuric ion transport protein